VSRPSCGWGIRKTRQPAIDQRDGFRLDETSRVPLPQEEVDAAGAIGDLPFEEGTSHQFRKIAVFDGFDQERSREPRIDGDPMAVTMDEGEVVSGFPPPVVPLAGA
jgi:hypothetical protein